jgi:dihydroneopterin aldolase/2-amino-4-hydroxy-6-hydroxymethyldihydropteridine diphosphokinase
MSDRIVLQAVSARGFHGVLDAEKSDGQDFVVDVTLEVDLQRPGRSDLLAHTVNYAEVAADVVALITGPSLDLIESLAEQIAAAALARQLVEAVQVTVHKPQAPMGVPFGDVSVVVERTRDVPVVIAVGANLGDVQATLEAAVRQLADLEGLSITAVSDLFETDPVGGPEQPVYLNAVVLARTRLAPFSLLTALHGIEADHGRVRETRWGARSLDLDLIQYGDPRSDSDLVSTDPELLLPHPRAAQRAFVLAPWSAVDAEAELRVGDASVPVRQLLVALVERDATDEAGAGDAVGGRGAIDPVDVDGVRPGPDWSPSW